MVTLTSHGQPDEPAMGRWACDCGERSPTDLYGRIHHGANQHAGTCHVLPPRQPTDGAA